MSRRPLSEAKKGDKVVIYLPFRINSASNTREAFVTRVNPKSITAGDERWDKRTGRLVGDPGYSSSKYIELWDEEHHPYEQDVRRLRAVLEEVNNLAGLNAFRATIASYERRAAALPEAEALRKKLKGET